MNWTVYRCDAGHIHGDRDIDCLDEADWCCPFDIEREAWPIEVTAIEPLLPLIAYLRGMCSDLEPHELIDGKLVELDGMLRGER